MVAMFIKWLRYYYNMTQITLISSVRIRVYFWQQNKFKIVFIGDTKCNIGTNIAGFGRHLWYQNKNHYHRNGSKSCWGCHRLKKFLDWLLWAGWVKDISNLSRKILYTKKRPSSIFLVRSLLKYFLRINIKKIRSLIGL